MEEKIKNTSSNISYNNLKTSLITLITFVFIFFSYIVIRKISDNHFVTAVDMNLGSSYNSISIILGILIISISAYFFYNLLVDRNIKLTKTQVKGLLWKVLILLMLIIYILMSVKGRKYEEFGKESFSWNSSSYSSSGFWTITDPIYDKPYDNSIIQPIDISIYFIVILITAIISIFYIKGRLKNNIYEADKPEYTKFIPFLLGYVVNTFMIFMMLMAFMEALEDHPNGSLLIPSILAGLLSICFANFEYQNKYDFKKSLSYGLTVIAIGISLSIVEMVIV